MNIFRIFLTVLFFLIIPFSYTAGEESPLAKDVKFDDIHINPDDYKNTDTNLDYDKSPEITLTQCVVEICAEA